MLMKWKRTIGWGLAGLLTLLVVATIAGYFYLKSNAFQQFALRKIVAEANEATGGKTEIGGLSFDLSNLTARLYNITSRGTEGFDQPPLLHADSLTVRLRILSALHHQVALRELLIDRPVIYLQVSRQGNSNLPNLPVAAPSKSGSNTSIFDLAVEHMQITNGEINYNDRKTPLAANLYDLGTNIRFDSLAKRYEGNLSYDRGSLCYAQYAPLAHNLNLKFSASPTQFVLESAILRLGSSDVTLHAQVSNYSNPVADGDYRVQFHTQDFAAMAPGAKPTGDVSLTGKLHYQSTGTQTALRNLAVNGRVASEVLTAAASGGRVELRKLQGTYQLTGGNLRVSDLTVETLGGRIAANCEMKRLDETPEAQIQASLKNISLRDLQRAVRMEQVRGVRLAGTVRGNVAASWNGDINNLRARSDLFLQGLARSQSNSSGEEIPVDGAIHATYDGARGTLALRETTLRTPAATLTAQGKISESVSSHSSLEIGVAANDLHRLVALASSFSPQTAMPAISGSATLNALVSGSLKKPKIAAQLNAQNLTAEGSEWTSVKLDMRANPSEFVVQSGSLVNAHRGQATFSASVGLRDWSYEASSPIKARLEVQQMRVADLQKIANQHYPISGDLSAKMSLDGSQTNPAGSGSAQLANAQAYGEPIQKLAAKFSATNGSIVSTLNVTAAAGAIDADLSYTPKTKAYKVKIDAPSVVLQKLQSVQAKSLPLTGTVSASVKGEGTVDDPQLEAVLQLPQLQVRQNSISEMKAEVHVASHFADLNLVSKVAQASVHAHGHVALSGDYETDAVIDTGTIPLDALMAAYAPSIPQGFQGQTELHATLKGPLKDQSKVEAHLSIPVLKASYQSLQIGIANPIHADYANSLVTLQPAEFQGTGTSLRMQGRWPIGGTATPTLSAQGSVDMRILKIVVPDVESTGVIGLDVRASGSAAKPEVQGQIQVKDVAITTVDAPVGVEKLNGTVDISNGHVQISKMTGQVGGGRVSVGGSITYKPSVQFNLALQGQSVRLRYPEGLRSMLDANLAFSGTTEASTLNGRVLIDSLSFTPDFDLAKFGDQFSAGSAISQPGFADTVRLAIGVQSQEKLEARSSQISIEGQAALQVSGTAANPVITGRTTLTSGELFYRNLRYQLQTGVITFDNPNETHPVMNVSATTTVEQYNLTLTMRGPLDKLTTSYVSDPPLATADIINLIAQGKTTQEANATSQSTDSIIASQAASQVSGGVQKLAGLSSLQIDPTIGGNGQNPGAQIAIQQRVTKNLLVTFSTDVSQPGSEMVQGEYQINKRWSVSAARDQLGGVSVDGRYHTRF
jgi:translocation and assembly module TamB